MPTHTSLSTFDFGPRTAPDLVASDEMLRNVMAGLAHLRRRLEIARAQTTGLHGKGASSLSRTIVASNQSRDVTGAATSEPPMYWFYSSDSSTLQV